MKAKRFWMWCVAGAGSLVLLGCSTLQKPNSETAINETLRQVAMSAEQSFDYGSAAGAYSQIHERDPKDIAALLGMARNLRYAGLPREAIKALKKALDAKGGAPLMLLELGKAQLSMGLLNDALDSLGRYRSRAPLAWQAHGTLGLVYDRLNRHVEAQESYRAALDLSPKNIAVTNNLALSLALTGRLDEATAMLDRIVRSENTTAQIRQNLALLHALGSDLERAEGLIRQDMSPEDVAWNMEAYRRLLGQAPKPALPGAKSSAIPAPQRKAERSAAITVVPERKSVAATTGKTVEATADMTVRARPAIQSARVARLKKGETAIVLGSTTDESWYYLVLDSGLRGFVEKRLIKPKDAAR